jgi:hypothetical protein
MSGKNGDKARYNRQRKEKLHKKARSRKLRKSLQESILLADPSKEMRNAEA